MRGRVSSTVAAVLLALAGGAWGDEPAAIDPHALRWWTDDSGGFRVEAAFLALDGAGAQMRRKDGREVVTPLTRLSEPDKAFLRRLAAGEEAASSWPLLFTGPGEGLQAEYFRDTSLDEIGLVRTDGPLDFAYPQHQPPYPGGKRIKQVREGWHENFAIRWSGLLVPRYTERYTLSLEIDDGAALWLGNELLIHSWRWQGPTEYTASVDLIAGRPYPLRILYYNGHFGGSFKFRWSSASQPKEIVPRECLFLPPMTVASAAPPDKTVALVDRVTVQEIPLSAAVKCDPRFHRPTFFLCPLAAGGYKLGWTDKENRIHLTKLSAEFEPQGKDLLTEKVDLRGLAVDRDGRTTLLMADMPNKMWLMHLDAAGKLAWRKCLVGEKGLESGQHFLDEHFSFTGRLAATGDQIAAHFAHSLNTGKGGMHQGGYFTLVDRDGKVLQEDKWTVSHSMDQRLLFHGGCWFTLSAGDCYPKGLHLQNRTVGFGRVVYPEPAAREAFGNCGGFVNAHLGNLVPLEADLATAFISKREDVPQLYLLRLGPDGVVLHQQRLADMPTTEQTQVVKLAPYPGGLLVAWREGESQTKLALVGPQGQLRSQPESVPHPLPAHDDLLVLPGGDVGWLSANSGESSIRLVRIRRK